MVKKNEQLNDAFDPDVKVMWNTRVHAGVIARFKRLHDETGLTMADLLTIACVEVEDHYVGEDVLSLVPPVILPSTRQTPVVLGG